IFGVRAELDSGCSTCGPRADLRTFARLDLNGAPGGGWLENHGVNVKIGLGHGWHGENAGEIIISSIEPHKKLNSAECLSVSSSRGDVSLQVANGKILRI